MQTVCATALHTTRTTTHRVLLPCDTPRDHSARREGHGPEVEVLGGGHCLEAAPPHPEARRRTVAHPSPSSQPLSRAFLLAPSLSSTPSRSGSWPHDPLPSSPLPPDPLP
eukprot:296688-Rhodomonas_salina.2